MGTMMSNVGCFMLGFKGCMIFDLLFESF